MAEIDFSLTPEQYKAQYIAKNREKLEPRKIALKKAFEKLDTEAKAIKEIDETYIAPWTVLRIDTKIKLHLAGLGDKKPQSPEDIAAALNLTVEKVKETLKERSTGDKQLFEKHGDKYTLKPETQS